MNSTGLDTSGGVSEELSEPNAAYAAELNAACQNLRAQKSDLERLLVPIHGMRVSQQQVSSLLKQTWLRLEALRASQADVSGLAGQYPEIARLFEQAFGSLQSGVTFSLDDANAAFEQACRRCLEIGGAAVLVASIRAAQAETAAVKLDYRRAGGLYAEAATTPGLSVPLQWRYQTRHALVLEDLGREFMDNAALEQAIDLYENQMVGLAPRNQRPQDWAATQHYLGNALSFYGQRQRGTRMLEKAIEAFERALSERSRERAPLGWAATQNSLGNTLGILAQRHADTKMLEKSVEAFQSALEERTQEQSPHDWAMTQNNLGAALHKLGERQEDVQALEAAAEAYENALKEWTREGVPMTWAMTMANLCAVRKALAKQLGDVELTRRVLTGFGAVVEVFREASHAHYYELIVEQVALTRKLEQNLIMAEKTASDE